MNPSEHKIIFIDRDGVLNWDPIGDYIKTWKDFKFIPGVLAALKKLSDNGYFVIVISNQAGIGDGVYPRADLDYITEQMLREVDEAGSHIDRILYCLHGKQEGCDCRKPKVGLFEQCSEGLTYEKSATYFIGDKLSDVQAGHAFGLKTIMVKTGHGEIDLKKIEQGDLKPDQVVSDLTEAVEFVLQRS